MGSGHARASWALAATPASPAMSIPMAKQKKEIGSEGGRIPRVTLPSRGLEEAWLTGTAPVFMAPGGSRRTRLRTPLPITRNGDWRKQGRRVQYQLRVRPRRDPYRVGQNSGSSFDSASLPAASNLIKDAGLVAGKVPVFSAPQ